MSDKIEDLRAEFADSKFVFVRQNSNWADEIDVSGYAVFKKKEFDEFLYQISHAEFPATRCFGTNEEDEIDSLDNYLYDLEFKEISQSEYKAFITMFEQTEAGDFWTPEAVEYDEVDEEEDILY
jgi:hypothetical protein